VRPNCGTATSIHIQDPDTNNLELPWYLQDASWATPWQSSAGQPASDAGTGGDSENAPPISAEIGRRSS
jgi:hypothetical protein